MTDVKTVITIIFTVLVLHISIPYVASYNLTCPSQANWKTRAKIKCNSISKYFCLYNNVEVVYFEGCLGPDWDRKGSKRIFSASFTRGQCIQRRYQPFIFWTNGSMSDCIYAKSICSEEGQIVYKEDSTKDDRACRCDHRKNYSFIKTPRNLCYCIPTEEDCSCYIRSCPANLTLSGDYDCIQSGYLENQSCLDYKQYEPLDGTTPVQMENTRLSSIETTSKLVWRISTLVVCSLCVILIIGGFLFHKWIIEKLQAIKMSIQIRQTDEGKAAQAAEMFVDVGERTTPESDERILVDQEHFMNKQIAADGDEVGIRTNSAFDGKVPVSCESTSVDKKPIIIKNDELNFLRMVHLLFRVACPVVRMKFNYEIQPNQLRKILDQNKLEMENQFRKKDTSINNYQWDLLYKQAEGGTVTSDVFDIRLMIKLLGTLANMKVGEKYPETADTSDSAMLSRIKFVRNKATRKIEGKLSDDLFNQYWDDIAQALLKLVPPHTLCIDSDTDKKRLIGRLLALNPIDIDNTRLCEFIDMSERYPAMILQKLIFEYCTANDLNMETILQQKKHKLYHKRTKTYTCCKCTINSSSYDKVISEKQWNSLYKLNDNPDSHFCTLNIKECSESFVPKQINTCDLSVSKILILHIPNILTYMINRLCVTGFDEFLVHNQHNLCHLMETKKCCKCNKNHIEKSEKSLINEDEWNKLFMKFDKPCQTGSKDCCCQYSVRNGIKHSKMDVTFLSKLFNVVGPISVLNKIEQDAFLYFLNWTIGETHIQIALTDLLNMIKDKQFYSDMTRRISCFAGSQSNELLATKGDACEWVSRNLQPQQTSREPPLQILVLEKDGLNVKGVHIPKNFPFPDRKRKFTDISSEENNFLLVFFGLTRIVYPLIQNQFNTHCPSDVLDKMHQDIYGGQNEQILEDSVEYGNTKLQKRINLTPNEQQQLFPPNKETLKEMDLKLMIKILKRRSGDQEETNFVRKLDIIYNISKEIVQSSSGVLSKPRFRDIFQNISEAVLYLGGTFWQQKLVKLQHIENILE